MSSSILIARTTRLWIALLISSTVICLTANVAAAQTITEMLLPDSLTTTSGSTGSGQTVANLHVNDQSGTQDDWENYVQFESDSALYSGFRSYTLPSSIDPADLTTIQVQANFRGPTVATEGQTWTWRLYDWSAGSWVTIGNNSNAPWWESWYLLSFDVTSNLTNFVEPTTREIRVRVESNNTTDNMLLDYEAVIVEYDTSGSSGSTTTVTYQPTTELFPNPERGFFRYFESKSSASPPTVWSLPELTSTDTITWLVSAEEATITQVYCFFVLDDFLTTSIDAAFLQNIRDNLSNVRAAGKKCILRFAYSNDGTDTDEDGVYDVIEDGTADADLSQILAHINQLNPILDDYADVIGVMHAGFIGVWGEWYYTNHFVDDPTNPSTISAAQYQRRRQVLDALLNALPPERTIAVRYPKLKKEMYNRTTPITAAEAFQNSAVARVGYHNDAFLNSYGDSGTFQDTGDEAYLASETVYLPIGGEINSPESGAPSRSCASAISAMTTYHWSYINTGYFTPALVDWETEGCIHNASDIGNSILDRLGYRLRLTQAILPNIAESGGTLAVQIDLVNEGFDAPINQRDVYLVLRETTTQAEHSLPLSVDPRTWLANGQTHSIDQVVDLPTNLPDGDYALYLHLPDADPTIAADERYAIRLANAGLWNNGSWDGYNALLHTLSVQAPSGPPTLPVQQYLPIGIISQSSPTFEWQPVDNATHYQVVIYDVGNSSIIADQIFTGSGICSPTKCESSFNTLSLPPGEYRWLVQAQNSFGGGPWSMYQ